MIVLATEAQPAPQAPAPQAPAPEPAKAPDAAPAPEAPAPDQGKPEALKPWMKQLERDLWSNEFLAGFDSFTGPARKLLEIEAKRERMLEIPDKDATDESKAEFKKRLQAAGHLPVLPEKAEDYKFTLPKLPEGMKFDEAQLNDFRQKCKDWGMTPEQAQKALEFDTQRQLELYTQVTAARNKSVADRKALEQKADADLRAEWGLSYEVNSTKAMAALDRIIPPGFRALLTEYKSETGLELLKDPRTAKLFFELDRKVGDSPFIRGNGDAPGVKTPKLVDTRVMGLPQKQ